MDKMTFIVVAVIGPMLLLFLILYIRQALKVRAWLDENRENVQNISWDGLTGQPWSLRLGR